MPALLCPRCAGALEKDAPGKCPACGQPVSADYLDGCRSAPPVWIVSVGYKGHGKTTFLYAWTSLLEIADRKVEGIYFEPLDPASFDALRDIRIQVQERKLPAATNRDEAYVLGVYGLPGVGNRVLVVHDVRGELFNQMDSARVVPALREVRVVWMLVSLRDLETNTEGQTLHGLFRSYQAALDRLDCSVRGRTVVVVYTKADQYEFNDSEISDYLKADPFQDVTDLQVTVDPDPGFSLASYAARVEEMSERLKEFTRKRVRGGRAFVNAAEAPGREVRLRFCVTSATGRDPNRSTGALEQRLTPYRVLDPLVLSLIGRHDDGDRPKATKRIALVLDSGAGSEAVYAGSLHTRLWEALKPYGRVTTYYLGGARPVAQPGQPPPPAPDRLARHRLVGAILEREAPDCRVLVLTAGPVRDLDDFTFGDWRKRVLLATTYEDHENPWPLKYCCRPGDTPEMVIQQLVAAEE